MAKNTLNPVAITFKAKKYLHPYIKYSKIPCNSLNFSPFLRFCNTIFNSVYMYEEITCMKEWFMVHNEQKQKALQYRLNMGMILLRRLFHEST